MQKNKRNYKNDTYNGEVVGIQAGFLPAIVAGRTDSRSPRPEPVPEVFLNVRYSTREGSRYQRVATGSQDNCQAAQIAALLRFPVGGRVQYSRVRDGEYAVSHTSHKSSIKGIEDVQAKMAWEALQGAAERLGLVSPYEELPKAEIVENLPAPTEEETETAIQAE